MQPAMQPVSRGMIEECPALKVSINGRFRVHKMTGMQRYADELVGRFPSCAQVIEPRRKWKGPKGHAWEQFTLPLHVGDGLLWSPCNTGPRWFRRQVVTIHDLFPFYHPEWFRADFIRAYKMIVPPLISRAQRIIAVSEHTKQQIVRLTGVTEDKVEVIYSGIGSQFVPQGDDAVNAARKAIGVASGRYLLSVSSLEPRKNVKRILEAWERALPYIPQDYRLVLAGGTGSETVFAGLELSGIPDRVVMPGYVAEKHLASLYTGASAFIFPSLAEGFGFPPLEAMACGTPVLTSLSSALGEMCADSALLVDPKDVKSIAAGIQRLATDDGLRASLQARGWEKTSGLDWDTTARRTWRVLELEWEKTRKRRTGHG